MHKLAERTILEGLKDGGLLTGSLDEMLEKSVGAVFMPHGQQCFLYPRFPVFTSAQSTL